MQLYTISGLGADKRVFNYLNLPEDTIHLEWIKPLKRESLQAYALRLSKNIDVSKPFSILGVSFGGMLAVEISKILHPEHTFLISTAKTKYEIPKIYRFIGETNIYNFLPNAFFKAPLFIISRLFRAKNKKLLKDILKDSDPKFTKWAVIALCTWKNEKVTKNTTQIHGNKDLVIPLPKEDKNIKIITDGGHFMVVDKGEEISFLILPTP